MQSFPTLPNFDYLSRLYQEDPVAFESFRRQILKEAVANAPDQYQFALQQTLGKIEATRSSSNTPMEAVVASFQLLSESVGVLTDAWRNVQLEMAGVQTRALFARVRRH